MTFPSLRGSATAAIVAFSLAVPAQAEVVKARYTVNFSGFHIGDATALGTVDPASYHVDVNAKLTGLAAMIASVRMALVAQGAIRHGVIAPAAYATTAANSHQTRTIRMLLNAGTVKAVEISPPFEDTEGRVPVTAAQKHNVLDPTSALIMAVPAGQPLVGPSACNRTLPIYDGVIRFNITMSYVGTRMVATRGYSGPVSVCAVRYVPVSGHKRDSKSTQFMAENRQIEAWLAPVEKAHVVVPFHVSLLTTAGTATIDAVEFKVEPNNFTATTH